MPQITIRNAHINYEILGNSGPWVALSPGGRRPLEGVKHLAERVAAKGYRELRVDGQRINVKPWPRLDRFKEHDIELPVARLGISARGEAGLPVAPVLRGAVLLAG